MPIYLKIYILFIGKIIFKSIYNKIRFKNYDYST